MRKIDKIKLGLLLGAILVWLIGYRMNGRALMVAAMAAVVVAFALRFIKQPPATPPAP